VTVGADLGNAACAGGGIHGTTSILSDINNLDCGTITNAFDGTIA
jgi:hypothetical protein